MAIAATEPGPGPAGACFVARQPVYDRDLEVFAYELLFRTAAGGGAFGVDPDAATSRTIVGVLSEIGLDALIGARLGLINVTRRFLLEDYALLLPPRRVGLEVLEDVDASPEVVAKLRELGGRGYLVALDDYVYSEDRRALLDVARLVKVDVLGRSEIEIREQVELLARSHLRLVAEKVEDYATFETCRDLGFDYFQGYFFSKPRTIARVPVPAAKLSKLQLIAALQDASLPVEELDRIVARDVGLSYRLLRLINSSFFYLPRQVHSIREALVLLGRRNLKNWASLLVLADIDDRPSELTVVAMIRARMCELLARSAGRSDAETCFTVGLFSVLDAFLDAPLEQVLAELPLDDDVARALLESSGPYSDLLATVLAYEQGRFEQLPQPGRDNALRELYVEALAWADEASQQLGART